MRLRLIILILATYIAEGHAIIGYNCGINGVKVNTYSLNDVTECDVPLLQRNYTTKNVQVIQRKGYLQVPTMTCLVEVVDMIYYCGQGSHVAVVDSALSSRIEEVDYKECEYLHKTGVFHVTESKKITGIKINKTIDVSMTTRGELTSDGACSTEKWVDANTKTSYNNHIKVSSIRITLKQFNSVYSMEKSGIILPSGSMCKVGLPCMDRDYGYVYYTEIKTESCERDSFDVLYEGPANFTTEEIKEGRSQHTLVIDTTNYKLGLELQGPVRVCYQNAWDTTHPELFVVVEELGFYFKKGNVQAENIKLFDYFNSKMSTYEISIASKLTDMYQKLMYTNCLTTRDNTRSLLTLARVNAEEFAYQFAGDRPGFTAVLGAEAVHVVECVPVPVTISKMEGKCFEELVVTYNNRTMFMKPRSRIIVEVAKERICNAMTPNMFQFAESWVDIDNGLRMVPTPPSVDKTNINETTWSYGALSAWIKMGIYTNEDLKSFETRVLYNQLMDATSSYITGAVRGLGFTPGNMQFHHMLDERTYDGIIKKGMEKFWGGFMVFGNIMASVIGFYWIFIILKYILNTLINISIIYEVYGLGWSLLCALFGGLTRLLIVKKTKPTSTPRQNAPLHVDENIRTDDMHPAEYVKMMSDIS